MLLSAHQPAYLPWLGYFHKIMVSDVFVILDDVQFEKGSFINRNRIKGPQGAQWLTVPVHYNTGQHICEVTVDGERWAHKHAKAIKQNYGKDYPILIGEGISLVGWYTIWRGMEAIAISRNGKRICSQTEMPPVEGERDDLLLGLCKRFGADQFLFGANGRDYIDVEKWEKAGIEPLFQEFHTPEYPQRYGEFIPDLSAIDALFNIGPKETRELLWSGKIHSL